MRHEMFMAGFGGQGVLLAGNLLGISAMGEGKNVSYFPAYGVEKRGGAAMCTVVIADGEVGSPVVGRPSVAIFLNQASFDRYAQRMKEGGLCIVNSSLVDTASLGRDDLRIVPLPMNAMAMEIGDLRLVNMVALGAYAALTGAVEAASLAEGLKKVLPERNHRFIPLNLEAIRRGGEESAC